MSAIAQLCYSLLLFLFLGKNQGDVISLLLSYVIRHPAPLGGAWCVAVLVAVAATWSCRTLSHRCRQHGLPSTLPHIVWAWAVTALVSLPSATWLYQLGLAAVAACGIAAEWWRVRRYGQKQRFTTTAVILLLLALFMGIGAAATDVDHYELQTARLLRNGHHKRALEVGKQSLATTPRLFALRCFAMSGTKGGLGNTLFSQPLPAQTSSTCLLLPDDARQALLLPTDSLRNKLGGTSSHADETAVNYFRRCAYAAGAHPGTAADYYLCALLLDRRIDQFARDIRTFYGHALDGHGRLPHYYAEALVMYTRMRTTPAVIYHDSSIEANLHDFSEMGDTIASPVARCNLLRRSYGDTYWWYFHYGNRPTPTR